MGEAVEAGTTAAAIVEVAGMAAEEWVAKAVIPELKVPEKVDTKAVTTRRLVRL